MVSSILFLWYGEYCLNKCEIILTSNEIFLDKELTVREIVAIITNRQSFSSCSCKSKSPYLTSKCAYLKKKYALQ